MTEYRPMAATRRNAIFVLAAVAAGIALRLCTVSQVVGAGRARALTPDCAYHLRRARFALAGFPRTIVFDPLINFPQGGICIWPPLFDLALAAPARLLGISPSQPGPIERTAAIVPLLFAALAIVAAGAAGLSARRRFGVAAAVFVALCTGHLHYSQFGQTDQHVAESCFGFWTLALFLRSCRRRSRVTEVLTGVSLAAAVLTWQGAIFWAPLLGVAILAGARNRPGSVDLRRPLLILGVPAALVAAGTGYWLRGYSPPFTYISFGWFQPVFLALTFAFAFTAAALIGRKALSRAALGATLAVAALVAVLSALHSASLLVPLREGIAHLASRSHGSGIVDGGFLSYPREWLAQIAEYQPLFSGDPWLPAELLSLSFFLSPLAIALWGIRALRGSRTEMNTALLLWGAFTLFVTITQRRNMYYAALLAALAAVELGAQASARLSRRFSAEERRRAPVPIFVTVLGALMLPMLLGLRQEIQARYVPGADLFETLDRLRQIVPHEVDAYDPRFLFPDARVPELDRATGVLAPWSLGHWITYGAELPVAADNFGYGFFDSVRFFLADDESKALGIARQRRCRFVVTADLLPKMNDYAALIGKPPYGIRTPGGTAWSPSYFESLQCRLYEFDGKGGTLPNGVAVRPLAHFRLRYASRTGERRFDRFVARWKIFEILQGPAP